MIILSNLQIIIEAKWRSQIACAIYATSRHRHNEITHLYIDFCETTTSAYYLCLLIERTERFYFENKELYCRRRT